MNHGIWTREGSNGGITCKDQSVELVSEKSPDVYCIKEHQMLCWKEIGIANITFIIPKTNKRLTVLLQPMDKYVCCRTVLDSQMMWFQSLVYSPRWQPSCRNIKITVFGWMFLIHKPLCYGIAFAGVFLTTIICISNDPCHELIILATIGNAEWRIMEANNLEVMYPAETLLSLVEGMRRANTIFWLPFLS